ncbi:Myb/SANT-like DNA-binding domain protein [Medicago truncatula]|uniref:Myb/SANT-like DNA-binding domain protein n=1 Tax=Medicago truncatula TaxID=3880 RepID=G7LBE3_MEDTR|nr:Myb/SANT-like DNA-binding domain protein [Medicago truncatula]
MFAIWIVVALIWTEFWLEFVSWFVFMASKESLPNSSENLGKAKWDTFSTKMLLDICMVEIHKCGKLGIAFRNKKWEEIRDEYNKRANKNYTQKQLKNRMDTLRGEWTIWKQLLGKETGLGWNHHIGNIDADSAWWDAKIRNVKYAKFRFQGLEFCDELEFIFGEIVATSQCACAPAMGVPLESTGKNTTADVAREIIESDDELNIDELSPMENTQSKNKRKVSPRMRKQQRVRQRLGLHQL